MVINDLLLKNYRNIEHLQTEFHKQTNLFYGDNGQGKTNIIESIYYLCYLKSFRSAENYSLIKENEKSALIKSSFFSQNNVFHSININIFKEGKKVFLDEKIVRYSSQLKNYFAIIVSTDLINNYKYKPQFKRSFFDRVGFIFFGVYLEIVLEYQRIVKYKNALLKKNQVVELETWNFFLAQKIIEIFHFRTELIDLINTKLSFFYQQLTGSDNKISIIYQSDLQLNKNTKTEELVRFFMDRKEMEIRLGYSFRGPQKDHFNFSVEDNYSKSFSQGEYKSLFLALQFAINELIQKQKNLNPLILLDDIFAEIDETISKKLLDLINSIPNQIFLTTTKLFDFFSSKGKSFHIDNGIITN